jgi:hypothetical protein
MKYILPLLIIFINKSVDSQAQKRITLSFKNASIFDVLKEIHYSTGLNVLMDGECLKYTKPVNLKADSMSIFEVLKNIFALQPIDFEIQNNYIFILPKNIKGKVIDCDGDPVPDVTITSTEHKVKTDNKGEFMLQRASCDELITLSYKHNKQTVKIRGRTSFVVKMPTTPKSIIPFDSSSAFTPPITASGLLKNKK